MLILTPSSLSWRARIHWPNTASFWTTLLSIVLIVIALTSYYWVLNQYAINVPVSDDYQATLQFLLDYEANPARRFDLLLGQHNEHRIVVSRLLALLNYSLLGEANFRQLLLWQSLFLAGLLWAVLWFIRLCGVRLSPQRLLPLVLLLFSLNTWETYLFVSGGSQSYPALLGMTLTLISLHQLQRGNGWSQVRWLGIGTACAVIATFSFGCGALAWAGGLLLLLLHQRWYVCLVWLVSAALIMIAYLHGYQPTTLSQQPLTLLRDHGSVFVRFAVSFPGASFQVPWTNPTLWQLNLAICYAIGLVSWGYFGYLTLSGYARRHPLVYTFIALFFAVDLLIAFSRCRIGVNTAFNSRYQLLSAMITIGLYTTFLLRDVPTSRAVISFGRLGLLAVFCLTVYYQPQQLALQHKQKITGLISWLKHETATLYTSSELQTSSGRILKKCRARIYKPEPDLIALQAAINADLPRRYISQSAPAHPASRR
ncbi:hypothetical protein FAES_1736 [Fibrella aestuarina BUZ 2]|uniref:Transmembrane protein n=2 Tax=Fibrella TaxID=861914 RepID=I0K6J3_9BACT|nr:hypothetical protein FAES_1736 [Fibrella aestuarina BUZ 2]